MASKSRSKQPSYLKRLLYLLATLLTGSGAGGWAFPETPVLGPTVRAALEQIAALGGATLSAPPSAAGGAVSVGQPAVLPVSTAGQAAAAPRGDALLIASFNIQVFGTSKLQNRPVTEILAAVVRSFDVTAIQEIRTQDDRFLDQFLQIVNAPGYRYAYLIGPRLGRSSSTEQYAFIYDTTRVEVRPGSVATLGDPQDALHREPLIAHFRTTAVAPAEAFSFWLVNVHTDPDEVSTELDALAEAYRVMQQHGADDDVILLGDLNASEKQLRGLGQLPGIRCAIAGVPTNTRLTKTYDNLLFDARTTVEYAGQGGVWNLAATFGLAEPQALEVSDHLPIWAAFSLYEGGRRQLAARPEQVR